MQITAAQNSKNLRHHPQFKKSIAIPALDVDDVMLQEHGQRLSLVEKAERRIVANLIDHLKRHGFCLHSVLNSDSNVRVKSMKKAMEAIFEADNNPVLYVRKHAASCQAERVVHGIQIVLGNGIDMISDYTFSIGDADGFAAAMENFDAEDRA